MIQKMKFGILKKFLAGFLVLSLVPMMVVGMYTWVRMNHVVELLVDSSRTALTQTSMSLLQARAGAIATQVEQFLNTVVIDLNMLATLPPAPEIYSGFYRVHQRAVWVPSPETGVRQSMKTTIPLYAEISFIDLNGQERILIREGQPIASSRDLSSPFLSKFGKENFFKKTMAMTGDNPHVSHLLGFHVAKPETPSGVNQVSDAEIPMQPVKNKTFSGIIRFSRKVFNHGRPVGVVSLALDHRHLMEFTQHVQPFGNEEVPSPNYFSGDYAFIFDDQGWMITHPKPWDIRGVGHTGVLVDPATAAYEKDKVQAGKLPFNLLHVPFVHENYATIAQQVIQGFSGVRQTASVGGIPRILAYAPIKFNLGEYRETGCFGGVTLGVQTGRFHNTVNSTSVTIRAILKKIAHNYLLLLVFTGVIVAMVAIILSRNFTHPIRMLCRNMGKISRGNYEVDISIKTGDELEILFREFKSMGKRLKQNEQDLVKSLTDLEKQAHMLNSIFNNMLSGLMVFDKNGTILSANPKATRFFKQSQQEITGKTITDLLAPYPAWLELIRNNIPNTGHQATPLDIKRPDNSPLNLETAIASLLDGCPKSNGSSEENRSTLLIFRDVTRRKNMEKHIARSDKLVSLGILAAGIAHEIRNPLTGITLMLDDFHDRIANKTGDRLLIQRALEEIEKLENIVNRLLDFAAKPAHSPTLEDINHVIDDTMFFISKQCRKQGVTLNREPGENLPRIHMDKERIRQAIINIVLNALNVLDHKGNITITTSLSREDAGTFVLLSIADDGPGIAKEDIDMIFDPFFSHNPEGFGLGLSITHTIVEEHGGKITVESDPEWGTCFNIHLPVS
ncbi:ATP-binding protein [Desulfocicer vacuolatum]|nr:ATP-binding protein [Desulfocicer vacuolatum]